MSGCGTTRACLHVGQCAERPANSALTLNFWAQREQEKAIMAGRVNTVNEDRSHPLGTVPSIMGAGPPFNEIPAGSEKRASSRRLSLSSTALFAPGMLVEQPDVLLVPE